MGISGRTWTIVATTLAVACGATTNVQAADLAATCGTVSAVVTNAEPGDTVTLSGLCSDTAVTIDDDLTLRGDPSDGTDGFENVPEVAAVRLSRFDADDPEVRIQDLVFRGGDAFMGSGGAISVDGCFDLTVERSTFTGNHAGADGGAIAARFSCLEASLMINRGSLTIIDSVFGGAAPADANTAGRRGGAIALTADGATLEISGSTFQGNRAGASGGAVALEDETAQSMSVGGRTTVTDSAFVDNVGGTAAATGDTVTGGALSLTTTALGAGPGWVTLTGNDFTGNRLDSVNDPAGIVQEGGAVAVRRASGVGVQGIALLESNTFTANRTAESGGRGGALAISGWDLTSYRDAFVENRVGGSGGGGGAVWVASQLFAPTPADATARIYGATMLRNGVPADGSGAALRVTETPDGTPTADAGAVVRQSTIVGSTGPESGVHGSTGTSVSLENSIVHGPGAAPGGDISGTTTATSSNVDGTDPGLTADGHETAASPGVNGGSTAGASLFPGQVAPALDVDGVDRIAGPAPDLGADEQAIADLAVTLDAKPSPAAPGEAVTYVARVENAGDDFAVGATATLTLPAGTTPADLQTDYGRCQASGSVVTCDLDALPLYEVARFSVRVLAPAVGPMTASLTAAAANPDPTPARASATTAISAPAAAPAPTATPTPAPTPTPTPTPLKATDVLSLPSSRTCVSRRSFTLKLKAPRGTRLTKVVVRVGTGRARTFSGSSLSDRKVDLRGLPRGSAKVRITVTTSDRRSVTVTRTFRTCATRKTR